MIRLLRLKTGEDLVADIDVNEDTVTLENPAMLMPMAGTTASGPVQMGFGPWVPFAKDKMFEISTDNICLLYTSPSPRD